MPFPAIAVLTNAPASGQHSMIGYGGLALRAATRVSDDVAEFRGRSTLSRHLGPKWTDGRAGRGARVFDRFVATPIALASRQARILHVVDSGNVLYLSFVEHNVAVVTVHDMIPFLCAVGRIEGFKPSPARRVLMRRILAGLSKVDRIVCVSESTRRDLQEFADLGRCRIDTIPNAVFRPMSREPAFKCAALRSELGLPQNAPLVLHVGGAFYKNRETVLEVFARMRNWRRDLHLVCVGDPTAAICRSVVRLGLEEVVHFIRAVPHQSMATLYSTSAVLLFPSLYEGFGYPVVEAQLCGTPVVTANTGSLPEVAGQGACLFDPHDVAGMAEAAAELIEDQKTAAAMITRGEANARRFSQEAWFVAHARLYKDLGVSGVEQNEGSPPAIGVEP